MFEMNRNWKDNSEELWLHGCCMLGVDYQKVKPMPVYLTFFCHYWELVINELLTCVP